MRLMWLGERPHDLKLTVPSQDTEIKLVDVARWLVEEHENGITRD
jgi:hypothetical protein